MRRDIWRTKRLITLYDFYDHPARLKSDVVDFGRGWRDIADEAAAYSLHWIADTGELYLLRVPDESPHAFAVPSLVRVTSRLETEGLSVEVLEVFERRRDVERALSRWQEFMPLPDSLTWLRETVAGEL